MKTIFQTTVLLILMEGMLLYACKKDVSCEGCINANRPPIALAGPDQVITLPLDSIVLDGSASIDEDGKIKAWNWKKISGPSSFHIVQPDSSKTFIKNLVMGVYTIGLTVKDDAGLTTMDTLQITVNNPTQPNRPPVAITSPDLAFNLPTNIAILNGSSSYDPDNNISTYLWRRISGPGTFHISNENAIQTQVLDLQQGIYEFELKVTDSEGLFDRDTMRVTVKASGFLETLSVRFSPADTMVKLPLGWVLLPTPTAHLNPSGFKAMVASVEWSQVSGPGSSNFNSTTSLSPSVSGLSTGVYMFKCEMTDTAGRKGSGLYMVSVSDPTVPEEERILTNLVWDAHLGEPWVKVNFTIPPDRSVRKVFIKQDCDSVFREVPHERNATSNSTFLYYFQDASTLFVWWTLFGGCWPSSGNDTPDIKIVY